MVRRMSRLKVAFLLSFVVACASRAAAPAPPAAPSVAEAPPPASCVRGVAFVDDRPEVVEATDVATCTARLDATVNDANASRRQEMAALDEQIAAASARVQAAHDAHDHFLDEQQVLRGVGLEEQLALMRRRVAKSSKPLKADVDEAERLEKLIPQDEALTAAIVAAEDEESKLEGRRGELMLSQPATVLQRCSACPPR
jgi:hypothetical protein